jgi:DNA (cytosine-5)-methyltransferase 1
MEKKGSDTVKTFVDLFAGIGGIRLGFESAGFTCVWSNEIDERAALTYVANFGDEHIRVGDIREIGAEEIPDFDVLCAGFPCQPFSIAGVSKKLSLGMPHGFEDKTQGTLFHEIIRILEAKRPQAFFLENVKNLKYHNRGKTFNVIEESIRELGYSFFPEIINAERLVPQNRERTYMIGFRNPGVEFTFPDIPDRHPKLSDILDTGVEDKYTLSDKLWKYLQDYAAKHRRLGHGFGFGLVNPSGVSRTLSARYYKDGSEILVPQPSRNPRRLTPRECARLQGFPDTFKIPVSDTSAYKQFGNSVAVPVIKVLARSMMKVMEQGPIADRGQDLTLSKWARAA